MNVQGMTPLMAAPLQAQATTSNSTTGTGSSGSTSSTNSASSLEGTFLSLLVTELQNQDPTQPVDPTQMVGEMISLNQLDQLININQTLSGLTDPQSPSSSSTSAQAIGAAAGIGSKPNSLLASTSALTNLGANGSHFQHAQTTSRSAVNLSPPAYPGTVTTGVLSPAAPNLSPSAYPGTVTTVPVPPAAWMNLYGNISAPGNATNKFNTVGGR